ncbi:MAG: LPXTG cell wall anchor domain-containing protein [Phycisphaerales bacterium JB038]
MNQVAIANPKSEMTAAVNARTPGKAGRIVAWIAQVVVSLIFVQSLFFKFTYAAETQVIFADLGGRLGATAVGLMELVAVVLLLIPARAALGALLSLGVISGAIFSHLFVIGIEVVNPDTGAGDGGTLFVMALLIFALSATILFLRRRQLPLLGAKLP